MATDAVIHDPVVILPPEVRPDVDHLVTEDDTPVDNIFSEKQQRLLTEPLHTSWQAPDGQPFVAMANVGYFDSVRSPAVVPDALLSLGVALPANVRPKRYRSYFRWEYGKTPDIVIEIVSNREGGEDSDKLVIYARSGIPYYVIFDPDRLLGTELLRTYRLRARSFEQVSDPAWFPELGLGLRLWEGRYEDMDATWLRWVDSQGVLIPTGKESSESQRQRADAEGQRADAERQRAEAERQRAEAERQRADRLTEQLRQLGVQPQDG